MLDITKYAQQNHDIAAELAARSGINLCDHADTLSPEDPKYPEFHILRVFHDIAIKKGASCEGLQAEPT